MKFTNVKNEFKVVDITYKRNLCCRSWGLIRGDWLHFSCEKIRWESDTVLKFSANFKQEWENDDKSGDLQAIF